MSADQPVEQPPEAMGTPFWAAVAEGRLELQRCGRCGGYRFFPGPVCPVCLEPGGEWTPVSGRGRLYSFTVVHRAPGPTFAAEVPYMIALVDLEEGPRLMARLEGCAPEQLKAGTPVILAGEGNSGSGPWMKFRLADHPEGGR